MMVLLEIAKDFLILSLVFIPVEKILSLRKAQKRLRKGWQTDLLHVFFTGLLIHLAAGILIVLSVTACRQVIPASFLEAVGSQPVWLAFIELLLIADLGFYWVHRAFHTIPWLWRFHAIHHSIEEMDFLAGHRVHPLDQLLTRSITILPGFALGFPLPALMLFALVYHWHSVLLHANTKLDFGPLTRIIASPRFHHWHHADCPEAINRNYAAQLSILDWVFGTLYLPRKGHPEKYGIDTPIPLSYATHLVYPFLPTRRAADSSENRHHPPRSTASTASSKESCLSNATRT